MSRGNYWGEVPPSYRATEENGQDHIGSNAPHVRAATQNYETLLTRARFQPESFSVNESLSNLVEELMKDILTDEKYKGALVRHTSL